MDAEKNKKVIIFAIAFILTISVIVGFFQLKKDLRKIGMIIENKIDGAGNLIEKSSNNPDLKIEKFSSVEDFKKYLSVSGGLSGGIGEGLSSDFTLSAGASFSKESLANPMSDVLSRSPQRVSETNVQVKGIDEPDIVKTDGKRIYYSHNDQNFYYREPMPLIENEIEYDNYRGGIRPVNYGEVAVLNSMPLEKIGKIEKNGEMLIYEDNLVVFTEREIYGYNMTDPKNPSEKWRISLEDRNNLVEARKIGDKIYLVVNTRINDTLPCPYYPVAYGGEKISVACNEIYHPVSYSAIDSTYTIMQIDFSSGKIDKKTSFVGASSSSTVYVSEKSIYITYDKEGDWINILVGFIGEQKDLFDQETIDRAKKINGYDISQESKMIEISNIMENKFRRLNDDNNLEIENELQNRMESYMEKRIREINKTGIVKIAMDDLDVEASGLVAGTLLNQFSLDEYDGYLRVATTTKDNFLGSNAKAVNDVYVLDKNLEVSGAVTDLGVGERIYSARFIGDRGYVVTFKETDPFYVLDLSNPENPQKTGELKIPGYSSYLHPLKDDIIVGIGKEGSLVKISLFDVSDPGDPREIDKYTLSQEYWSEALDNHHAFLTDNDNEVFFIPGSRGGYVFSYADNKLELKLAASEGKIERAIYIGNYLYVIGEDKIIIYNEKDWSRVSELNF